MSRTTQTPENSNDPAGEQQDQQDHHLWRNGRLWWVAFTVHHSNWTAERIRRSLSTDDLAEARRRRDRLFAAYENGSATWLSIRFPRKVTT